MKFNAYFKHKIVTFHLLINFHIGSKENYDQVIKEWNKNAKNPAKYLVFARDDKGWVKLEPKSKLSEDDLQAIEEDKRAKVEYENR